MPDMTDERAALERMHALAMELPTLADLQSILQAILSATAALHGATRGVLSLCESDETLIAQASLGFDEAALAQVRRLSPGVGACGMVLSERRRVIVADTEADPRLAPFRELARAVGFRAVHATPIVSRDGALLGVLSVHLDQPGEPTALQRRLADMCAQHAADAVETARLSRAETNARFRVSLLDGITRALMAGLPSGLAGVERITTLLVPGLADWAAIYVPTADGGVDLVAMAHADAALVAAQREKLRGHGMPLKMAWGAPEVLRTGRSELVADVTDAHFEAAATSPAHLALLRASRIRSSVAVPLAAHGRLIGCLVVAHADSGRRFTAEDVPLVEEVAVRAALTLELGTLLEHEQQARREAEAATRAKDEFLAMLGHELRNPLAPIVTALQLWKLRGDDGAIREQQVIERQVDHLVRLVDDLLDVSRIASGKIELKREVVSLVDVVTNALEMASPLLEQRQHHVDVAVPSRGMRLHGDAGRLAQVVANLLTNAAKYTPPGGHVSLRAWREDDQIHLAVRDDGRGIEAALLPRIFDLFVQGPRASDRADGGLGLGLALVRSLVQLHGGIVEAHSDGVGRGSEFLVRLPGLSPFEAAEEPSGIRLLALSRAPQPRRILIVDDNVDAAEVLAELLRAAGHTVSVAHDGPEALRLSTEVPVLDLALLDIGLPVMDGYELASRLRRHYGPTLHMVAVTGYGQSHDRTRSTAAGFDQHFVKPVAPDALLRYVASFTTRQ